MINFRIHTSFNSNILTKQQTYNPNSYKNILEDYEEFENDDSNDKKSLLAKEKEKNKKKRQYYENNLFKRVKTRLKDIGRFSGIRNNYLVGYGLVVGLNGTGDTLASSPHTKESITGMLERLGINIRDNGVLSSKNVAAVMVTATLPPFAKKGTTIDINVSAIGDAKSLQGGTLVVTSLQGADNEVYAVAQGELIVSGITAQGVAASQTTGIPTTAKIANGAIIEKQIDFELKDLSKIEFLLHNPDITTAKDIANKINAFFNKNVAIANDSASIQINISKSYSSQDIMNIMAKIEQLEIRPDQSAKVIIDPAGVIVMGEKVKISPIALTHGSITVRIVESADVYQPNPLYQVTQNDNSALGILASIMDKNNTQSPTVNTTVINQNPSPETASEENAQASNININSNNTSTANNTTNNTSNNTNSNSNNTTFNQQQQTLLQALLAQQNNENNSDATVIPNTDLSVKEEKGRFAILNGSANLQDLVDAFNLLQVTPREMAQILQTIKASGALHAEVIVY